MFDLLAKFAYIVIFLFFTKNPELLFKSCLKKLCKPKLNFKIISGGHPKYKTPLQKFNIF